MSQKHIVLALLTLGCAHCIGDCRSPPPPAATTAPSRRTPEELARFELLAGYVDVFSAKAEREGYTSLTEAERTICSVWELEGEVNNGGFDQYFFNSADGLSDVVASLKRIGATTTAQITADAFAIFPPPGPSQNRSVRQQQLDALPEDQRESFSALDKRFYKYPDNLEVQLAKYARANLPQP